MKRASGPLDSVALKFIMETGETSVEKQRLALNVLTARLSGVITAVQALEQCYAILGTMQPAQKINSIIDTPLEPIAFRYKRDDTGSGKSTRSKARNWVAYEDQRLLAGVWKYGLSNWPLVARFVGNGRTRNQCSQRWNRGLNPVLFKGPWTPEENEKLIALVKEFGEKSWKRIASVFGNRSDVQCRYHFQQIQKRRECGSKGVDTQACLESDADADLEPDQDDHEASPEKSPPKDVIDSAHLDDIFDLKVSEEGNWNKWVDKDYTVLY